MDTVGCYNFEGISEYELICNIEINIKNILHC